MTPDDRTELTNCCQSGSGGNGDTAADVRCIGSDSLLHRLAGVGRRLTRPVPDDGAAERAARVVARSTLVDLAIVVAVVGIVTAWTFELWSTSLRVPFGYGGDGLFYGLNTKTIVESGWMQTSSRLGAPFGMELYDFPIGGDSGNYVLLKVMSWFSSDWALLTNVFYLFGFFTTGIVAYVCLRWLGSGRVSAVVCAVLYAIAPYHFVRLGHLMLAHYAILPVGVVLAVRASSGRTFRTEGARRFTWLVWLVACLCVGSFGTYWAIFSLISILFTGCLMSCVHRSLRPLGAASSFAAIIFGMFMVNQAGTLLYHLRNGSNPAVAARYPIETDVYGLRLIQMLAPVPRTRWGFLEGIAETLSQGYSSEGSMHLGVIAATALVAVLAWTALRLMQRPLTDSGHSAHAILAVLTTFWILVASTGGLQWIAVALGFDRLRAWNRASILIMFLVLAWAALCVAPIIQRLIERFRLPRRPAAFGLAGAVLVIGIVDQTTDGVVADVSAYAGAYASDREFFGAIEAELAHGAMVAQLPVRRFPEVAPEYGSADYDLVRPYLSTSDLRFTYGGMKWRESEWQQRLRGLETRALVSALVAVGAHALIIDRAGYPDFGAALESELAAELGITPRVSADTRWSYFRLDVGDEFGDSATLAALRNRLLGQPVLALPNCVPSDGTVDQVVAWCGKEGAFTVVTPEPGDAATEVSFDVAAPGGIGTLHLHGGGRDVIVGVGPDPSRVRIPVPAGENYLRVEFEAEVVPAVPATPDRLFSVSNVRP
jgi:phosphoglycerol transferase